LGEPEPNDQHAFAAERMLFVEFNPYASERFAPKSWHTYKRMAGGDDGFAVCRQLRTLLMTMGRPRVVLGNGKFAAWDVKDNQCPTMREYWLASPGGEGHWMQTWIGEFCAEDHRFSVVGFKQLGRRQSRRTMEADLIRRYVNGLPLLVRTASDSDR
jgi:hypothetical protein